MALWRWFRGWSPAELEAFRRRMEGAEPSFQTPAGLMDREHGWREEFFEEVVGREAPGLPEPGGLWERARHAVEQFEFSEPRIMVAHFDRDAPVEGRLMLLEFRALGGRMVNGVRVQKVVEERTSERSLFCYCWYSLEGHPERGWEAVRLEKDGRTGEVRFAIEDRRREGDFPNWFSQLGFRLIGTFYRNLWMKRAATRLRKLQRPEAVPVSSRRRAEA